jgi:glycosyltransferase involved in cell wall biosynthesis
LSGSGQVEPRPLLVGAEWFPDTPGGLNRTFRGLFLGLSDAGLEPRALVVGPVTDQLPGLTEVPPGPLPLRLWRMVRGLIRLRSRGNIVNAHFALYGIAGVVGARLGRHPLMVHFHGPWAVESAVAGQGSATSLRAKHAIERAVYRRADSLVVHTYAFKRLLVERYGVSPWTVEIVPPPVDLEHFTPGSRAQARERLGIPEARPVAVSVRRLTPRMGLDDLVRAWARLPHADAELYLAGRGPDRPRLESLTAELGLEARVHFLGSVPDDRLPDVYRAADVCIAPSRELEGFGLVVIEALACGTPVVVSDAGGLPEAVAGLGSDLVVPAGDHEALADRLEAAFAGARPLPAAERCREYAEQFSPARFIERHRDLYTALLNPAVRRRRRVVYVDRGDGPQMAAADLAAAIAGLDDSDAHVLLREDGPLATALQASGVSVEVPPGPAQRRLRALEPDVVCTVSVTA